MASGLFNRGRLRRVSDSGRIKAGYHELCRDAFDIVIEVESRCLALGGAIESNRAHCITLVKS